MRSGFRVSPPNVNRLLPKGKSASSPHLLLASHTLEAPGNHLHGLNGRGSPCQSGRSRVELIDDQDKGEYFALILLVDWWRAAGAGVMRRAVTGRRGPAAMSWPVTGRVGLAGQGGRSVAGRLTFGTLGVIFTSNW